MTLLAFCRQTILGWILSYVNQSQLTGKLAETLNLISHWDNVVCLQESLADYRHQRFVSMNAAFDDLDSE